MDFRILGPLEVIDGEVPVEIRPRRQRSLLAFVLLHPRETLSVDRLLDALWGPRPPPTAVASVYNAVSQLRKRLGVDVICTRPPGYAFGAELEAIDAVRFERLVDEARAETAERRAELLEQALGLWRGAPLADVAFEPFVSEEVAGLEDERLAAFEALLEVKLELGHHADIVPELERLVDEHPLREQFRQQLILALYRCGRQADALAAFDETRSMLRDELGLDPSAGLQRLHAAILRQDPLLDPPRVGPQPAPMQRRSVTVLFADVAQSTALSASLDIEPYARVMRRYWDEASRVLARRGGTVEKFIGDAVVSVFGVPRQREDDALRAVASGLELQQAVAMLNEELAADPGVALKVRVGVETGEVVTGGPADGHAFAVGRALNVASKLQHAAPTGAVLVGPATYRLVRDRVTAEAVEPIAVGADAGRLAAFRVVSLEEKEGLPARHLEAPLVGRAAELEALHATFERCRRERSTHVLTVLGEAGIGKTRLARALVNELQQQATVLVARCVDHGEGATYLPLVDLIVAATRERTLEAVLADDDRARDVRRQLDAVVRGDGAATTKIDLFWALRRLLEALARSRPVVLVVEDVHWAAPTVLDLIEHVGTSRTQGPLFVLCLGRSELRENRPGLAGWSSTLDLYPLTDDESQALVENLAGNLPRADRDRVVAVAEGNPLFAEQLLAHLSEDDVPELELMPPSLHALIASRLDRLDVATLATLQHAAVGGREFDRATVFHACPPDFRARVDVALTALCRRGLVDADRERDDAAFSFHHALIREVAYSGMPKALRAEAHERIGRWLDGSAGDSDELVGYHLERAYLLSSEVAKPDRAAQSLAKEAGRRLGAAGISAWQQYDGSAAVDLLGRAVVLLPERDPRRLELLCELGTAFKWIGSDDRAEANLLAAAEVAAEAGMPRLRFRAELERAWPRFLRGEARADEILELAERARAVFEKHRDERGLSRAWLLIAAVNGPLRHRWAACADAAERALRSSGRARFSPGACLMMLAAAIFHGPESVETAIRRCHELVARAVEDPSAAPHVLVFLGSLEAMRGRIEVARAAFREARDFVEERGARPSTDWAYEAAAVEMLAGDLTAAEVILRDARAWVAEEHDRAWLAMFTAASAEIRYVQRRYGDALELSATARELAPVDDLAAQTTWRRVHAKACARRGAVEEGEQLAREAVDSLEPTDALNQRGLARLDLAEVFFLGGRRDLAVGVAHEGVELLRRKGNVAGLERQRARLAEFDCVTNE